MAGGGPRQPLVSPGTRVRRFLRSPWTITAELSGIVLAGLAGALLGQHPTASTRAIRASEHPFGAAVVEALGLDRVFTSPWFLAVVALSACSLAVVVWEQWTRLSREWGPPPEGVFRNAPYRIELTRTSSGAGRRSTVTTRGRAGQLGSPLFHTGLLLVALAGVGRMLVGADAAGEVVERATVPAGSEGLGTQERGLLAAPVALPHAIRLVELRPSHYPSGDLLRLSARIALDPSSPDTVEMAVNAPLDVGDVRLFLTQDFGPAFLLEFERPAGSVVEVAMLRPGEGGDHEWNGILRDGIELRLRSPATPPGARPIPVLDVRVLAFGALLAAGRMQPGSTLEVPRLGRITLRDVRWWVKLVASRDPTTWPMYLGFGISILGVILLFGFVRTDELVTVEPDGDVEHVVVALRPRRLAPIFAERFARLVEREKGANT